MARHNVVHVYKELDFGGTAKSVELFVRHLDSEYFDVQMCCFDALGVRGRRLREQGFDVDVINSVESLITDYLGDDVDIVHVHGSFKRGTESIGAAKQVGVPIVVKSTHFGLENDGKFEPYVDRYLFVAKMALLRHLRLTGTSLETEAWADRHALIYNPIDLNDVTVSPNGKYRQQFDIPEEAPVLGKIGRAAPAKWGMITLEAFDRLLDTRPDTRLLLANAPDPIRNRIDLLGLSNNIHYIDGIPLEELSEFYNSIDILAHSSAMGEVCPYVVLESMAHETPTVVNSQPMRDNGQIELVENGVSGYVANRPRTFAAALLELIESDETRKRMGIAGRRLIEEQFEARTLTARLERIYLSLLHEKGRYSPSDPEDVRFTSTDMVAFDRLYRQRLTDYYGDSTLGYNLERITWETITRRLPVLQKLAYYGVAHIRNQFQDLLPTRRH